MDVFVGPCWTDKFVEVNATLHELDHVFIMSKKRQLKKEETDSHRQMHFKFSFRFLFITSNKTQNCSVSGK